MAAQRLCTYCGLYRFRAEILSGGSGCICHYVEPVFDEDKEEFVCSTCGSNDVGSVYHADGDTENSRPRGGLTQFNLQQQDMTTKCTKPGCVFEGRAKTEEAKIAQVAKHMRSKSCPWTANRPNKANGPAQVEEPAPVQSTSKKGKGKAVEAVSRATVLNGPTATRFNAWIPANAPGHIPHREAEKEVSIDVGVGAPSQVVFPKIIGDKKTATDVATGLRALHARVEMTGLVVEIEPLILEGASWTVAYVLINSAQNEEDPADFNDLLGLASANDQNLVWSSAKDKVVRRRTIVIPTGWTLWTAVKVTKTATTTGVTGVKVVRIAQEPWFSFRGFGSLLSN
jgi:hypothetical protein